MISAFYAQVIPAVRARGLPSVSHSPLVWRAAPLRSAHARLISTIKSGHMKLDDNEGIIYINSKHPKSV